MIQACSNSTIRVVEAEGRLQFMRAPVALRALGWQRLDVPFGLVPLPAQGEAQPVCCHASTITTPPTAPPMFTQSAGGRRAGRKRSVGWPEAQKEWPRRDGVRVY